MPSINGGVYLSEGDEAIYEECLDEDCPRVIGGTGHAHLTAFISQGIRIDLTPRSQDSDHAGC